MFTKKYVCLQCYNFWSYLEKVPTFKNENCIGVGIVSFLIHLNFLVRLPLISIMISNFLICFCNFDLS